MAELLYRLGRLAARRAKTVVAAWLAVLVAAGVAFLAFGGTLASTFTIPDTPTAEVTDQLADEFPEASGGTGTLVLQTDDGSQFSAEQQEAVGERLGEAEEVDGVTAALNPFTTEAERGEQLAQTEQGRTQLEAGQQQLEDAQTQLDEARQQAEAAGALEQVEAQLDEQQATLDASRAELQEQAQQLELGSSLLEMAAGLRTVSEDGSAAIVSVSFTETQMEIAQDTKDELMAVFDEPIDGVSVDFSADIAAAIPSILGVSEVVGLVVAGVVLLVMLGTLVGAGLPLVIALVSVGIGALGALSLSGVVDMVSVTPVLGLMLGLAVGIDYSLFIVNRHRRQLKQGVPLSESIGLANGTSGNAVVFAGATVLIALLALNVTGIPFLGLMGTIGALCIAVAVMVAVTLTPALLGLMGERVLSRRERERLNGTTVSHAKVSDPTAAPAKPMSTPAAVVRALACVGALILIALPATSLRMGLPDGSAEAVDSTQYQAYTTTNEKFGAGLNGTLLVVADVPTDSDEAAQAAQLEVAQTLFNQDDVVAVAPIGTSEDGSLAAFQVIPAEGPQSESTEELVHALRDMSPINGEYAIGVAGSASGNIDISEKLADALPVYLAVVVGLSLIILVVVFRSIFVPVIATLGFILSFFAALGGVVAIYQWGWLSAIFGVDSPGPIINFLPTILVGILFGLAMDYMLFLGTGMREAYVHGAPARIAVVQGLRAGRAVVTAAAIIMVSVFGGFVFSHSAMIRPIGFALAFGVLLDAFVVRMVLIPALMHLAGDKAWWLPKWLDKLLPDVDVEGSALERAHGAPAGSETEPVATPTR